MENIKSIIKMPKLKKPPAYKWQELALVIIAGLADGDNKKNSIFKCCKQNAHLAQIAYNDARELGKPYAKYFLKVFNDLVKKTK